MNVALQNNERRREADQLGLGRGFPTELANVGGFAMRIRDEDGG